MKKKLVLLFTGLISIILMATSLTANTLNVNAVWGGWSYNPGWEAGGESSLSEACAFLVNVEGYTPVAASGVLGNFNSESGMNPYLREAVGNHATYGIPSLADALDPDNDSFGPGRGLAQWGDGSGLNGLGSSRWLSLVDYVNTRFSKKYPKTPSSSWNNKDNSAKSVVTSQWPNLIEQLSYVKQELLYNNSIILNLVQLNSYTTPESAAQIFAERFEKPADLSKTLSYRQSEARRIYNNYCRYSSTLGNFIYKNGSHVAAKSSSTVDFSGRTITNYEKQTRGTVISARTGANSQGAVMNAYKVSFPNGTVYEYAEEALMSPPLIYPLNSEVSIAQFASHDVNGRVITSSERGTTAKVIGTSYGANVAGVKYNIYRIQHANGFIGEYLEQDVQSAVYKYNLGSDVSIFKLAYLDANGRKITTSEQGVSGFVTGRRYDVTHEGTKKNIYKVKLVNGLEYEYLEQDVIPPSFQYTIGSSVAVKFTATHDNNGRLITLDEKNSTGVITSRVYKSNSIGIQRNVYTVRFSNLNVSYEYIERDITGPQFKYTVGSGISVAPYATHDTTGRAIRSSEKNVPGVIVKQEYKTNFVGASHNIYTIKFADGQTYQYLEQDIKESVVLYPTNSKVVVISSLNEATVVSVSYKLDSDGIYKNYYTLRLNNGNVVAYYEHQISAIPTQYTLGSRVSVQLFATQDAYGNTVTTSEKSQNGTVQSFAVSKNYIGLVRNLYWVKLDDGTVKVYLEQDLKVALVMFPASSTVAISNSAVTDALGRTITSNEKNVSGRVSSVVYKKDNLGVYQNVYRITFKDIGTFEYRESDLIAPPQKFKSNDVVKVVSYATHDATGRLINSSERNINVTVLNVSYSKNFVGASHNIYTVRFSDGRVYTYLEQDLYKS